LSPDLAVDIETCVAPPEDFPHQGKTDELFPQKQGKNPKIREQLAEFRERRVEIKRAKLERIVEYIDQNSPTNFRDIYQSLEIKESPLYQYLKILRDGDLIDWMNHKGKIIYFRKS
jgi:hypothetical protein